MPGIFSQGLSSQARFSNSRLETRQGSFGNSSASVASSSAGTCRSGGSSSLATTTTRTAASSSASDGESRHPPAGRRRRGFVAFYSNRENAGAMDFSAVIRSRHRPGSEEASLERSMHETRQVPRHCHRREQLRAMTRTSLLRTTDFETTATRDVEADPSLPLVEEDWGYFVDYVDDRE